MRKTLLTLFLLFTLLYAPAQRLGGKDIDKVIEVELSEYFPLLPFGKTWQDVLTYFEKDTNYVVDSAVAHTDSTDFYLRGVHKTYNPFSFTPKTGVLVCFWEHKDHVVYLVTALLDNSPLSKELADKEVDRIDKNVRKYFAHSDVKSSPRKSATPYKSYSYLMKPYSAWWFSTGSSYTIHPYYTGYYVVLELSFRKDGSVSKRQ